MKETNSSKYNTVYANPADPSSLLFTVISAEDAISRVHKTQTDRGMLRSEAENFANPLLIPIQSLFFDISWIFLSKINLGLERHLSVLE